MRDVSKSELSEILHKHRLWHRLWLGNEEGGERADLRHADLRHADLSHAYLRYADLGHADLNYANLRHADLRHADLRYVQNFYLLPVQDPRGYTHPHAVLTEGGWRIRAGCRDHSIADAREHWGEGYTGLRSTGDMYLHACDWLEKMISEEAQDKAA